MVLSAWMQFLQIHRVIVRGTRINKRSNQSKSRLPQKKLESHSMIFLLPLFVISRVRRNKHLMEKSLEDEMMVSYGQKSDIDQMPSKKSTTS